MFHAKGTTAQRCLGDIQGQRAELLKPGMGREPLAKPASKEQSSYIAQALTEIDLLSSHYLNRYKALNIMADSYPLTGDGQWLVQKPEWSIAELKNYVSSVAETLRTWGSPLPEGLEDCNLEARDKPVSHGCPLIREAHPGEFRRPSRKR